MELEVRLNGKALFVSEYIMQLPLFPSVLINKIVHRKYKKRIPYSIPNTHDTRSRHWLRMRHTQIQKTCLPHCTCTAMSVQTFLRLRYPPLLPYARPLRFSLPPLNVMNDGKFKEWAC